jgi:hypothetical protein
MQLALYAFWLLPIPVLAAIAVVMYRRKQHISYPFFWAYTCFECVKLVIEFICKLISYKAYFYAYWATSFLDVALILLLLRAVFVSFLEKYPKLDGIRRHGFEFAVSAIWFTGVALNLGFMRAQAWPQRITRAELILGFSEVGLFVFVLITTLILGIRWKSAYCGIAAGLGLLGAADLVVFTGLSWVTQFFGPAIIASWIETLAFDGAVAIFAYYFLPAPATQRPNTDLRPELLEWAESMKGAVRK